MRITTGVVDAGVAIHLRPNPSNIAGRPFFATYAQDARKALALGWRRFAKQTNEHQRALAFPEIAVAFLAIAIVGHEVEQVILNLKGRAQEKSEVHEFCQIYRPA